VLSRLVSLPDDSSLYRIARSARLERKKEGTRGKWGGPCSGACKPIGRRSCTRRSTLPPGTTERLRTRTNQLEQSSRGGACVRKRWKKGEKKVNSLARFARKRAGTGKDGPVKVLLGHLERASLKSERRSASHRSEWVAGRAQAATALLELLGSSQALLSYPRGFLCSPPSPRERERARTEPS
jgi:hypothetical protein